MFWDASLQFKGKSPEKEVEPAEGPIEGTMLEPGQGWRAPFLAVALAVAIMQVPRHTGNHLGSHCLEIILL